MLTCKTTCPKCKHQFACCPAPPSINECARRSLSGGGLVTTLVPPTDPCLSPQVSPSAPVSFVLPPFAPANILPTPPAMGMAAPILPFLGAPLLDSRPETELQRLTDTLKALRQSGWYYEGLTFQESHDWLKKSAVGTFLVRNSSDPKFLFSLSVQTHRGPMSVRIHYVNGYFRFDAQTHIQAVMPMFGSVVDLIQHYVVQFKMVRNGIQAWVDNTGNWYSSICLEKPFRKEAPSLKHLARLAIHKAIERSAQPRLAMLPAPHTRLDLPTSLTLYLSEYPYTL